MATIRNGENGGYEFYVDEHDLTIELDENNTVGYLHRDEDYETHDMVGIQDPTDEMWWTWFRAQYLEDTQTFEMMMEVAQQIGTVLLRDTPLTETEEKFNNRFRFTDDDFEQLLDGSDE